MSTRRRRTENRSAPYDMGEINKWYADQFHAKLAEKNIHVPPNDTKAELKSLYLTNLMIILGDFNKDMIHGSQNREWSNNITSLGLTQLIHEVQIPKVIN